MQRKIKKHSTHLLFREQETEHHSINITNHKTPSVINYNQLRKGVRVEERRKAKREDVESSPTDHEGRTFSSSEGILSPRRAC